MKKKVRLSRLELEIMKPLWQLGRGSIREIQEELPSKKRVAYTTVQTIISRLEEKNIVRRVKKIGNAYIYEPLISRLEAQRDYVAELLDLFGDSAQPLMAHLVETGKLSLADIREMEKMLNEQESQGMPDNH